MKRVFQCMAALMAAVIFYWLYWKQFGAIPFLLISIFLFYKAYGEYSGRIKKQERIKQTDRSTAPAGKKAEIIT